MGGNPARLARLFRARDQRQFAAATLGSLRLFLVPSALVIPWTPVHSTLKVSRSQMSSNEPLISVVMPVYNNAPFITDAVVSVLQQTYKNLDIVILDDGSTDDTYAILQRLTAHDPRVRLMTQPNAGCGGIVSANRAVSYAQGSYLARLDGDDVWHQDKLSWQMAHMQTHPHLDCTFTHATCIDVRGTPIPGYHPECFQGRYDQPGLAHRLLLGNILCHGTILIKTDVLRAMGPFDTHVRYLPDHDMWMRLLLQANVALLARPSAQYRIHDHNFSSSNQRQMLRDSWRLTAKYFSQVDARWPLPPQKRFQVLCQLGEVSFRAGDYREALSFYRLIERSVQQPLPPLATERMAHCRRVLSGDPLGEPAP